MNKTIKAQGRSAIRLVFVLMMGVQTASCSKEQLQRSGADMLRGACSDMSKCTYRCPDGTETDPNFPRCE